MVLRYNWLGIDRLKGGHCRSTNGTVETCWAETSGKKSAVELLQETKGRYVKSGSVLESTQKPDRPDHLKITPPAHSFTSLIQAQCVSPRVPAQMDDFPRENSPPTPEILPLTSDALAKFAAANTTPLQMQNTRKRSFVPPRLRPRAKTQPIKCAIIDTKSNDLRRSYSHGHSDLQSKLRQLLNTESKESLHIPAITGGKTKKIQFVKPTHKSLPDLMITPCLFPNCSQRRPSCPDHISCKKRPPPIPPRPSNRRKEPVLPPPPPPRNNAKKTPPPRPPPPKMHNQRSTVVGDKILCSVFTGDLSECINNKSPKSDFSGSNSFGQMDIHKRPIVRSVSDVTHERSLGMSLSDGMFDYDECDINEEKIEQFFESLGWTVNGYYGTPPKSPPVYFEEDPSSRSNSLHRNSLSSLEEVGSSTNQNTKIEPSIIEKNARVIKWLFKVQKAINESSPLKS